MFLSCARRTPLYLSKNKEKGFWDEERKCENVQHLDNLVDVNSKGHPREHQSRLNLKPEFLEPPYNAFFGNAIAVLCSF
jgi:hypothetical protein